MSEGEHRPAESRAACGVLLTSAVFSAAALAAAFVVSSSPPGVAAVFLPACALAAGALWAVSEADPASGGPQFRESASDNMTAGLMFIDADDRFIYVSCAAERLVGVPRANMIGKTVSDIESPVRTPMLLAMDVLKHGKRPVVTGRFPIGSRVVVAEFSRTESADGGYGGLAALLRDTTEDCTFCGHMMRVERMTVLGELAAAMAHEINSPLSGVMESVRIIQKNAGDREKTARFLALVQQGLSRMDATVKQMLKFTVPQEEPRTSLVLEDIIEHCVEFLQYRRAESDASLELDLAARRTVVRASEHSLSQVLINLINNAFDAIAGQSGGRVLVKSELLPESAEVMVQVADNGPGVPAQLRSRIFEPFFTTKASGRGTGLGLSICARIAASHGGRIMVSDNRDGGAVFSLVLPLVGRSGEEEDVSGR